MRWEFFHSLFRRNAWLAFPFSFPPPPLPSSFTCFALATKQQWQSEDPGVCYISEWLALSHGYKINIEFGMVYLWCDAMRIVCESRSESESANNIERKGATRRECVIRVLCMGSCECVSVSEFRNVANRSYNRWPDRKIIEKYCREDNNLFWQVCFRCSRRRFRRRHCCYCYCYCSLLFVFRFVSFSSFSSGDCDVLQKKNVPIKYLWFWITICTAHCCRSFSHSQNNFRIPICGAPNKYEKIGLY